ncbi:MAG: hypothetical protein JNM42_10740 [Propionivibrio sp.]|uniref:surface-adhesin E family protein n=1 Tax=Propionivibrio sp. TaxID=2212460 RepID=UPI001A3936F3|nr:surface-adhesin E family protein [Propionivibrio sp.]MBL8414903.1 hypothetical protein [Propionivibrio sp.]
MRRTSLAHINGIILLPDIFLLKTLVKAILPLLLAVMSTGVMAEWVQVYWGETSDAYADLTTIRKKGKTVRMWDMVDLKQPQVVDGVLFQSVKSQTEYDCGNVRSRLLTVLGYSLPMGNGVIVLTEPNPSDWEPVIPGTHGVIMWNVVCSKSPS